MVSFRAKVSKGRLILDVPTDLPDGTEVELLDSVGGLDADETAELHASLARGSQEARLGKLTPAQSVLDRLRQRG